MPRTRIRADQAQDISFVSEAELNQFLDAVVITGTEDATTVVQLFDDYFPGRGLIVGVDGNVVVTGTQLVTISGFRDEFLSASGTFLKNVVEDLTPQLGGDLDVNGKSITSAGNTDINIRPAGTGGIELYTGLMDGDADDREIWLATSGGGDIILDTATNIADIFIQSGDQIFLTTANVGKITIDADGFMDIRADRRLILESVTETVDIKGALGVNFFDPILGENGTAAAPSFGFKGDSDTGFYRAAPNQLGLVGAGQTIVTVTGLQPAADQDPKGIGIDGNLTVTGTVGADRGTFDTGLTVSGIPVDITGGGGTSDHSSLSNLDFASAGHTGFASTADTDALAASGVATDANIVSVSGHLQGEIDSIDSSVTLQEAYDNGDGTIASTSAKPVQTGDLTATGTLKVAVGTSATPALTFSDDTDTGIFNKSADVLGFSAGATETLTVSGVGDSTDGVGINGNLTVTGTVASDVGTFETDVLAGGTVSGTDFKAIGIILTRADAGDTSPLSIGAVNAPGVGISFKSDKIRFVNGVEAFRVGPTSVESLVRLRFGDGSEFFPGLSLVSDTNMGFYKIADDTLGLSTGAIKRVTVSGANSSAVGEMDIEGNLTVTGTVASEVGTFTTSLTVSGVPVDIVGPATLQEAYDNGDGTIASTTGKPVQTGDLTTTGTLTVDAQIIQTLGTNNVIIGDSTAGNGALGSDCIFIGDKAGAANTAIGDRNVFVGSSAGDINTDGFDNIFIGESAGGANLTTDENIFIGTGAGRNSIASQNVYIGHNAGESSNSSAAKENVYIGYQAGEANLVGGDSVMIGWAAGNKATAGGNVYIGAKAGDVQTAGNNNVYVGLNAGGSATTGNSSVYIGSSAGFGNTGGAFNTVVGRSAGSAIGATYNNAVLFGFQAGKSITTGARNLCFGNNAGQATTIGHDNTYIGPNAGFTNIDGSFNIAIGRDANLSNIDGERNLCYGFESGKFNLSDDNMMMGYQSGQVTNSGGTNLFIGNFTGLVNTIGAGNVYIGFSAGRYQTTESDQFILDNRDQGSKAAELTDALMFGTFNAIPSNQTLTFNAGVTVNGNLTVTGTVGADVGTFDMGLTVSGVPVDIVGLTTKTKNIAVEDPTSAEDISWFFTPIAITVTEVTAVNVGTSPSVTISIMHNTDRNAAGNNVLTSATAITNTTTGQNPAIAGDVTIPIDSFVWLETSAQSGTVDILLVSLTYTED